MTPKHIKQVPDKDDKGNDRKAIAPYNFVELPDVVVPAEEIPPLNQYHSNRHTGKIECVLTTDSPLYIRCGMTPDNFAEFSGKDDDLSDEQKKQKREIMADFFQYPTSQLPALAGSSLRGMLRTLVEIVGYGKLTKVSENQLIYRAVGDTTSLGQKYRDRLLKKEIDGSYSFLMQAGYIVEQKSGWAIQPAKLLSPGVSFARIEHNDIPKKLESWKNIKNAYKIAVQVEPIKTHQHGKGKVRLNYAKVNKAYGNENGVLVKTGSAPRKHMEFVFGLPDENARLISISNEMIDRYKEQITDGQTKIVGEKGVLQDGQPVFYRLEDEKLIFFGHAMMFRLPYEKSVLDFIPEYLRDPNTRDLAEAIFGFVQDEKQEENQAQAGRVFIGDAICQQSINDDIWWTGNLEKSMTPMILASPKPTTFQHYLVQTTADKKELKHYGSEPEKETVIRGHKLYWHKGGKPSIKLPENQDVSESQTTDIKPIKSGVSFNFTIHFENLSAIELGALLWVLNLAADPKYRLSLGMGKPLGMGAVKITHKLWLCDRANRYSKLFQNNNWATGDNLATVEESEKCVNAFESYILKSLPEQEKTSQKLKEVPRIKMLLAMLSFPGLSADKTRYMEIERDVNKPPIGQPKNGSKPVNEYQERPVLPTPLQVIGWSDDRIINNPPPSSQNQPITKSKNPAPKPKSPLKKRDTEGGSGTNLALQRPPQKPKR